MKLLILGGTNEASQLARKVAEAGIPAVFSYAGRVAKPDAQPVETRVGGYGGVEGLIEYISTEAITHLIDATHPFAAGISRNAIEAAEATSIPMIALSRPPWMPAVNDHWRTVGDMRNAAQAIGMEPKRVFLSIGRSEVGTFAAAPQHSYLLRFVDQPEGPPPLPDCEIVVARGPFEVAAETALLADRKIEVLVSKNSGGTGAAAKLQAARTLGIPVIMIERPTIPKRPEVATVAAVLDWLRHESTDLGV